MLLLLLHQSWQVFSITYAQMVGGLLIDEVLNCRNLIVAKVAEAELVLNLFKNVDKLGDVIVAKVLLWVFLQDF